MKNFKDTYKMLYNITNIPMCLLKNEVLLTNFPTIEKTLFTENFIHICLEELKFRNINENKPLVLSLNPGYYLGLAKLSKDTYIILGPSVLSQSAINDIKPWIDSPLYKNNQNTLIELLTKLPHINLTDFLNILVFSIYLYSEIIIDIQNIVIEKFVNPEIKIKSNLTQYLIHTKENTCFHTPESLEIQLTKAIEEGNIDTLKRLIINTYPGHLGLLSTNSERQIRYMFVTASSVFARAAMRGGVNYELACSMADSYCQKMDSLTDISKIEMLRYQMIIDFCKEVVNTKKIPRTMLIKNCCDYISKHSHELITLSHLSKNCKLSERRLSNKFQKEMGMTITDYIHLTKLEEAKFMLLYTNHTISEICNYLGYSSQSYFTFIFKKHTNVTPTQFRNTNLY